MAYEIQTSYNKGTDYRALLGGIGIGVLGTLLVGAIAANKSYCYKPHDTLENRL